MRACFSFRVASPFLLLTLKDHFNLPCHLSRLSAKYRRHSGGGSHARENGHWNLTCTCWRLSFAA